MSIYLKIVLFICVFSQCLCASENWPQWRGPDATGTAHKANPPIEWSETKNVKWKIPIPGKGHSTPVVWQDHVFVTTAIDAGEPKEYERLNADGWHNNLLKVAPQKFVLLAIHKQTGNLLWQKTLNELMPHEGGHETASLASHSPVTDGEHIIASFGSHGIYCLDFDGKLIWKKDLGNMHTKHAHGEGSSPVLYKETLVINWDHQDQSFIIALNKNTGKQLWKVNRNEPTSWATPIIIEHNNTPQVIVSGTERIRSYNLKTGNVIWACGGLSNNVVASPVYKDGILIAGSSYVKRMMLAIKLDGAKGDITNSEHVLWRRHQRTPYVPSPLFYKDSLYVLRHYQPILSRIDPKTGIDQNGPFRLPGLYNIYASPVAANDKIYITDQEGNTLVIEHNKNSELKTLALNQLEDRFNASAAISKNQLFLRGEQYLYCISEKPTAKK